MRLALALLPLLAALQPAAAQAPRMDGPVAGGAFGMGGADYHGEVRDGAPSAIRRSGAGVAHGRRPVRTARRAGDAPVPAWHGSPMLMLVLLLALLVVLTVMIVSRRWVGRLASLATLLAGALTVLWLAQVGLLPGSTGPLTPDRPPVPGLDR